jgi:hypothetical protein
VYGLCAQSTALLKAAQTIAYTIRRILAEASLLRLPSSSNSHAAQDYEDSLHLKETCVRIATG